MMGDQVHARDAVGDMAQSERLEFDDPPRRQPFAADAVTKLGLSFN
jgi:hypothetical protein